MEIKKVGVLGCGLMGSGIAQTAATAGFEVVVREVSNELCERGFAGIEKSLAKFAEKGTISADQQRDIRGRMTGTTEFAASPTATSSSKPSSKTSTPSATLTNNSTNSASPKRSSLPTPLRSPSRR
jgi:pyruvate/2-oxoglutarate dehydrogenase complex dihydrolipoamide dehydrogenase (E3) component